MQSFSLFDNRLAQWWRWTGPVGPFASARLIIGFAWK